MINIKDVLDLYRVRTVGSEHHHVGHGWVGVDCPRCSPQSGKFRLGFQISTGRVHCWQCGRLDAVDVLVDLCNISKSQALNIWKDLPRNKISAEEHTGTLKLPSGIEDLREAHRRYLRGRGLDPNTIEKTWSVRGFGPLGAFAWRLYIPIMSKAGVVVSWTTRKLNDGPGLRYVSASTDEEAVPHKSILYGAHLARHIAIILEGPIDAWTIGPGAVATCGTSYSSSQMVAMSQYPIRIVCFDNEKDAQKRATNLCRELSTMPGITENVVLESGKDVNSADPAEVAELKEQYIFSKNC